jgi:PIN domain nuclease of toxin-antitoxin system
VKLLLDTHVLLWAAAGDPRLRSEVAAAVADPANSILVSAASAWEIAIKAALGRPTMNPEQVAGCVAEGRFVELPVTIAHANHAGELPPHHRDPFDRMLVAQARVVGATLVTHDRALGAYDVPILWA